MVAAEHPSRLLPIATRAEREADPFVDLRNVTSALSIAVDSLEPAGPVADMIDGVLAEFGALVWLASRVQAEAIAKLAPWLGVSVYDIDEAMRGIDPECHDLARRLNGLVEGLVDDV